MPVPLRDCVLNQLINKPSRFRVIAITLLFVNELSREESLGLNPQSLTFKKKKQKHKTKQKTPSTKLTNNKDRASHTHKKLKLNTHTTKTI